MSHCEVWGHGREAYDSENFKRPVDILIRFGTPLRVATNEGRVGQFEVFSRQIFRGGRKIFETRF